MTMRDNDGHRRVVRNDSYGWGIPAAIAAVVLILGGLFFFSTDTNQTTTASNDRPAVTQSGPAGSQTAGHAVPPR